MQNYALIIGHGRSGTNWLMDILDASPLTFCRSEPNEVKDSPFGAIAPLWQVGATQPDLDEHWDELVTWMSRHIGERDHHFVNPKIYIHPRAQKLGLAYLSSRPRLRTRQKLQQVAPALLPGEWPLPWYLGDAQKLQQAYAIFKINQAARVAVWLLNHRPQVPVLHIVRHPGGRLNSWLKRFLAVRDKQEIAQRNHQRLHEVLTLSPEWAERFGTIEQMNIAESEMWFWRYVTEQVHQVGEGRSNYKLLLYENLAFDPIKMAQAVYQFCNLPWTPAVEAIVRQGINTSVWGDLKGGPMATAQAWRKKLKSDEVDAVNKVLTGSLMERWWDE
ncbi:MAG: sulfotransferase [Cyanobacteria bacterium P01_G01_bin.54]